MTKNLIILLGPTGVGKTDLSIELAKLLKSPILSSDSRQFYKEMNIGTAVPERKQLDEVKHYFIGHKSIHDYYNVFKFESEAIALLDTLFKNNDNALMIGGSGMYIDVICKGIDDIPDIDSDLREQIIKKYEDEGLESLRFDLKRMDPDYYKIVDLRNKNRMLRAIEVKLQTGKTLTHHRKNKKKTRPFKIVKLGLQRERSELYKRIDSRVESMMDEGLFDEARELYPKRKLNALNTVGYRELFDHFDRKISYEKAVELIKRNSRRYAKRQLTWFKRDKEIIWFDANNENAIVDYVKNEIIIN